MRAGGGSDGTRCMLKLQGEVFTMIVGDTHSGRSSQSANPWVNLANHAREAQPQEGACLLKVIGDTKLSQR